MQEKKEKNRIKQQGDIVANPTIGVFLAEPIADFVAVCTTGSLFYRYYRRELADKRDS